MSDDIAEVVGLLLGALSGGLAGSLVMRSFASRRAKLDLAISVAREFMSKEAEFAVTLSLLSQVANGGNISSEDRNKIFRVGDWFETACYLGRKGHCTFNVLEEMGVIAQACRFRSSITEAARRDASIGDAARTWHYLSEVVQ